MEKEQNDVKTQSESPKAGPSDSPNPQNSLSILSTSLSQDEYIEIKDLSTSLGVSVSHMGRAIIRLGLANIKGVAEEARESLHLRLIKLGK